MNSFNGCVRSFPIVKLLFQGMGASFRPLSEYIYCTEIKGAFRPQNLRVTLFAPCFAQFFFEVFYALEIYNYL